MRRVSSRLLRAYRLTRYQAGGYEIRIGRLVSDSLFAQLQSSTATLLTAWNPLSQRMPNGRNERMQLRLRLRLRRLIVLDADGSLGGWREAMLLVGGPSRRAVRLARQFRQSAVLVLRRRARVQLVLLEPLCHTIQRL